jgi:hypothetical protein
MDGSPSTGEVPHVVADRDAARAGSAVRALIDRGERVVGFVGDEDDPACSELIADLVRRPVT